jgi:hypothetical protein
MVMVLFDGRYAGKASPEETLQPLPSVSPKAIGALISPYKPYNLHKKWKERPKITNF